MTSPTRILGRTRQRVTILGLGGEGVLRTVGQDKAAAALINRALDLGITYCESARAYSGSEAYYGKALGERRRQIFLASKSHNRDKKGALAHLHETLTKMKTDHLDLWQVHQILTDAEADSIFIPDGVLGAIEQAKKQGKIRYCGFTGHANPKVHLRVLAHRYPFDSVQMPLSVFDAHADGFQKFVLPEALKQSLAPLAMKTLGGNAKPIKDGLVTSEECLRYAFSLPVTTVVSGIDTMEWLQKNARVAAGFKPLTPQEMAELAQRCSSKKEYEYYRRWAYSDGDQPHALYA
jgi:predicted aldo/keto reductase-like oxidoreductase